MQKEGTLLRNSVDEESITEVLFQDGQNSS